MAFSGAGSGNPRSEVEVIALSPKTLMATNQFLCEVCNKGFPREQNLQLHRRGHNLPYKLKKKINQEVKKKIYICPQLDCVNHDPSRALGDLAGMKKHFTRKHGEKKFNCYKCDKKYAVHSDWKAHNKICGTKEHKCECGTTFSRRASFISHRSVCYALAEEVARNINFSTYSSTDATILANPSNPGSMSLGLAAGSLIPGNNHDQQLTSLFGPSLLPAQSVGSSFQPIQPPNMPLHPFPEPKLISFPRVSDFSGIQGFPINIAPSNLFNLGFNGSAGLNSPQNDLDLNTNNSFSGLLMNAEASVYNILNSTPFPQSPATALFQKAGLTGANNSNNAALMKSRGSSLSNGMQLTNYSGALGDGVSGVGSGDGSSFQEMYSNLINVGGGSYGSTGGYGGGMEYLIDQVNAPYGGMMYNMNNNVLVEPQMNVQNDYCDRLTRDFLGITNGMNSLSGGAMVDDPNGNGMGINSADSEAIKSAEARPFVPGSRPGF